MSICERGYKCVEMMGSKVFLMAAAISTVRLMQVKKFNISIRLSQSIFRHPLVALRPFPPLSSHEACYAAVYLDSCFSFRHWATMSTTASPALASSSRIAWSIDSDLDHSQTHLTRC